MPIEDYFLEVFTGLPVVCVEYSVATKSLIDKAPMKSMPIAASADKMRLCEQIHYYEYLMPTLPRICRYSTV